MSVPFTSKAWLLDGPVDSLPGVLDCDGACLRFLVLAAGTFPAGKLARLFAAHGRDRANDGTIPFPAELFSVSLSDIRTCRMPWYYFNGGLILEFAGLDVRFSFLQPQNTLFPTAWNDDVRAWIGGGDRPDVAVADGRAAGKRWRALLAP